MDNQRTIRWNPSKSGVRNGAVVEADGHAPADKFDGVLHQRAGIGLGGAGSGVGCCGLDFGLGH